MIEDIHEFRRYLRHLERFVMANLKDDSMCCGVTPNQCHILLETADKGEIDVSDLKNYLGLDKSSISRTADSLVDNGLLVRKEKKEDRRYQSITLSPNGVRFVENIDAQCDFHYSAIFDALPAKIRGRITEDLQALSQAFFKVSGAARDLSCCEMDPFLTSSADGTGNPDVLLNSEGGKNGR